jgi:S1-C subfamily serine protease
VVISKNGTILTALHAVKGALEVQVRLSNGEVYDRVELIGTDERRDVAALKVSAGGLPFLTPAESLPAAGDPVFAVTNANGLTFSATSGILSAIRPADEVPGAGTGFRLLQFTAPVAPGASGGALVDKKGQLIGIITGGMRGGAAFAVPIDSVLGLPDSGQRVLLGSGRSLQMPSNLAAQVPQSSAALADVKPKQLLHDAKTIHISSKTSFLTTDTLIRALTLEKNWDKLGLTIVQDARVADLLIEIDRPLFTYVHTFVITDKRTSVVLGSGKVTAFDGTIASGGIADDIDKIFAADRLPKEDKK